MMIVTVIMKVDSGRTGTKWCKILNYFLLVDRSHELGR
jgi:hypothetical protein